uniref:Uncharacterized protein n=1 Tax=Cajanus cajan TaxID=3821 RepID=A0A151T5F2_CAJCA|nr:hypothetical protein KK1_016806 [Cajanus cajan]
MMKNCWQLCSQADKLWVRILGEKYGCGNDIISLINKRAFSFKLLKRNLFSLGRF